MNPNRARNDAPTSSPVADALVLVFSHGVALADWDDSGMIEREWALYAKLASSYGRIVLVTAGDGRDDDIASKLAPRPAIVCNTEKHSPKRFAAHAPARVAEALDGAASVVVKTNQMDAGELALSIARELRARGVRTGLVARGGYLWSRFVAADAGAESSRAAEAASIERALCSQADTIVASTESMIDDLAWRYGLPRSRTRVVPNFVLDHDPSSIERAPDEILAAGTLCARKRIDLLIEAIALIPTDTRPRLTIVGEGEEQPALEALARDRSVNAIFLGRLAHRALLDRMARCTIFAHTSALEGHPKTILEAMATGTAVVACDAPGTREVIAHNRTALLVNGSHETLTANLADTLAALLENKALRDRLGRAARAWTGEHLSLQVIVPQELEAHRDAIANGGQAGESDRSTGAVRWDAELLVAGPPAQAKAFGRSIAGLARRLDPPDRVRFLMALDAPIYEQQGIAAVAASATTLGGDGLHPKHRIMRYHDFFTDRINPGERVIDLGCGVGALACSIATRCGARVVGMDLSDQALDAARARIGESNTDDRVRLIRGDITTDRAEGSFDVLVLSNVLEHLRDRSALLAQYRAWYGVSRFLIRVPALDRAWQVPFKRELGIEWRLDDTHELEYTRDSLDVELREAGLTITDLTTRWGEYWLEARPTRTRV